MKVYARISKDLNQIKLIKRGQWDGLMSLRDAQRYWKEGRITKSNAVFKKLAENDFDVTKTLAEYQEFRESLNPTATHHSGDYPLPESD